MTPRVLPKWRPTLGLVVAGVLTTVMALPLVGLFFFRFYENQLIRQTESELIAQSAVLAAVFARQVEALPDAASLLGGPVAGGPLPETEPFRPIEATLDLAGDSLLGRRPEARTPAAPADPRFEAVGRELHEVALRSQRVTLAGFRLLDPKGVVIAGRGEGGLSLAHVEEVADALGGRYRAVLRTRVSDQPPPPLYSISRGTEVRVFTALPVVVQDRVAGVVYASRTPNNVVRHLYDERRRLILAGLTVLAAALLLGWIFSRAITRPIHALVARTREVGRGDRDALRPLAHHGTREIALLSQAFIDMAQRLRDRSDYIATFAAHVSHELKSPLTSIQGAAELLRDAEGTRDAGGVPDLAGGMGGSPANLAEHKAGFAQAPSGLSETGTIAADAGGGASPPMSEAERRHFLDNIIADTARLTRMLHRLRELARADNPHREGSTTLAAVATDLESRFPALRIEVGGDLDRPMALSPENALIVFSHLADNAVRHGSTRLRMDAEASGDTLRIELRDDGEGVSERNRDRIFDAFFTTRRESGGTGMGLGIVRAMLQAHEGSIALLPSSSGTAFRIVVPAAR